MDMNSGFFLTIKSVASSDKNIINLFTLIFFFLTDNIKMNLLVDYY